NEAETLFREACDANPGSERAFRQLAMVLAEKDRWRELELAARNRVVRIPWDPWGWMALGLAQHRQGNTGSAAAAFDSALTYLDHADRSRLDRIERVLRRADS